MCNKRLRKLSKEYQFLTWSTQPSSCEDMRLCAQPALVSRGTRLGVLAIFFTCFCYVFRHLSSSFVAKKKISLHFLTHNSDAHRLSLVTVVLTVLGYSSLEVKIVRVIESVYITSVGNNFRQQPVT